MKTWRSVAALGFGGVICTRSFSGDAAPGRGCPTFDRRFRRSGKTPSPADPKGRDEHVDARQKRPDASADEIIELGRRRDRWVSPDRKALGKIRFSTTKPFVPVGEREIMWSFGIEQAGKPPTQRAVQLRLPPATDLGYRFVGDRPD